MSLPKRDGMKIYLFCLHNVVAWAGVEFANLWKLWIPNGFQGKDANQARSILPKKAETMRSQALEYSKKLWKKQAKSFDLAVLMVETKRIELSTLRMQTVRSPEWPAKQALFLILKINRFRTGMRTAQRKHRTRFAIENLRNCRKAAPYYHNTSFFYTLR